MRVRPMLNLLGSKLCRRAKYKTHSCPLLGDLKKPFRPVVAYRVEGLYGLEAGDTAWVIDHDERQVGSFGFVTRTVQPDATNVLFLQKKSVDMVSTDDGKMRVLAYLKMTQNMRSREDTKLLTKRNKRT